MFPRCRNGSFRVFVALMLGIICSPLVASDALHIHIMDMQGHTLAQGDVRMTAPARTFQHLKTGDIQIELTDTHQQVMQFSGDLNADGVDDCVVDATPRHHKKKKLPVRSFLVIKEWGPSSRTIPCTDENDARTKFNTALTLGRNRDQVFVLKLSFSAGECSVEVLSWSYATSNFERNVEQNDSHH